MSVLKKEVLFKNRKGLHIRAAAMLVQKAHEMQKELDASLFVRNPRGHEVPATALMALYSLHIKPGDKITVLASGAGAGAALDRFSRLLEGDLMPKNIEENDKIDSILEENALTSDVILDSITDGLIVVDADCTVTVFNRAAEEITGIPQALAVGKNLNFLLPGTGIEKVLAGGRGEYEKKKIFNGRPVIADLAPIKIEKKIVGGVIIFQDISRMERLLREMKDFNEAVARAEYLEEELIRSKKLDRAFDEIVGRSGKLLDALAVASKAAATTSTVLIRGESGTGKELVARAIHSASKRKNGPFVRVNCPAIPQTLLESELFGHERGAFTGALYQKIGKFELANGGTIFLDEIGEMGKDMQTKLLRVLQEKEFERVGGNQTIKVDVRIIAATNRNLEEMVKRGEFREDLYYRLNVVPIFLPSLRERKEDIPLLAEHFREKLSTVLGKNVTTITPGAMRCLMNYDWPGNARELENIIERAINLTDDGEIDVDDLPSYISGRETGDSGHLINLSGDGEMAPYEEYEKEIIRKALKKYRSFNAAAKVLGITHKTVAAKARKYGLV
ncbi:sigma 54-interacting transcriptional regulator [Thermosediminibacter litoriperuensis]|uniref:sigma 54-interacting transcriptional regulator n=1 Tax=Thermosediminibacter litoriperuensis TaxID=291989 RepID=UPI0011E61EF7